MGRVLALPDAWLDLGGRNLHTGGRIVRLTPIEAELLRYLADQAPRPISPQELMTEVWGYHPQVRSGTVKTTVMRLRRKLEPMSTHRNLVWESGVGYRLVLRRAEPPSGSVTFLVFLRQEDETTELELMLARGGAGRAFAFADSADMVGYALSSPARAELMAELVLSRAPGMRLRAAIVQGRGAPPTYKGESRRGCERLAALASPGMVVFAPEMGRQPRVPSREPALARRSVARPSASIPPTSLADKKRWATSQPPSGGRRRTAASLPPRRRRVGVSLTPGSGDGRRRTSITLPPRRRAPAGECDGSERRTSVTLPPMRLTFDVDRDRES